VRALGEMDDRLEILEAVVEVHAQGFPKPLRFERKGSLWLGLVCGLSCDLSRSEADS
jgi:hypothetical protein